jgi:hypothetical protein
MTVALDREEEDKTAEPSTTETPKSILFAHLDHQETGSRDEGYSPAELHNQVQVCAEYRAGIQKTLHVRKRQHWVVSTGIKLPPRSYH